MYGSALQKFSSDSGRDFVLGPTHEDVVAFLAAREINSYMQLPQLVYQIQTKYRNEARARGGLVRLREFTMKDAYSLRCRSSTGWIAFMSGWSGRTRMYLRGWRCRSIAVEADTGAMGGRASHEFVLRHDLGEDRFVACDSCGYAANVETAQFALPEPEPVERQPVQKVATPDCKTIQQVADFIGVPTAQTLKAVFFVRESPDAPDQFVFVVIRGDLDVNETKLINALGGGTLRPATDDEILATGAVPGYASPLGFGPGGDGRGGSFGAGGREFRRGGERGGLSPDGRERPARLRSGSGGGHRGSVRRRDLRALRRRDAAYRAGD